MTTNSRITQTWRRVSRAQRCPVCAHPDWCLVARDATAAICARIESARRAGEAGWLHVLVDRPKFMGARVVRCADATGVRPAWTMLAQAFEAAVNATDLDQLGRQLGLTTASLKALGIGWTGRAWTFPMVDGAGRIVGMRLRCPDGAKRAITGGKEGLFVPTPIANEPGAVLFVAEGATDTAALLDMGFAHVVGRPSCSGGIKHLVTLVQARRCEDVVLVADGDAPGLRGADNLAAVLVPYVATVRVIAPPSGVKDARAWMRAGGSADDIRRVVAATPVKCLVVRAAPVNDTGTKAPRS